MRGLPPGRDLSHLGPLTDLERRGDSFVTDFEQEPGTTFSSLQEVVQTILEWPPRVNTEEERAKARVLEEMLWLQTSPPSCDEDCQYPTSLNRFPPQGGRFERSSRRDRRVFQQPLPQYSDTWVRQERPCYGAYTRRTPSFPVTTNVCCDPSMIRGVLPK